MVFIYYIYNGAAAIGIREVFMEKKDFEQDFKIHNYDKIFNIIVEKDFELVNQIAKIKKIDVSFSEKEERNIESDIYHYYFIFKRQSGMFRYVANVIFQLHYYFYEGIDENETDERRLELYIEQHNNLQDLLNQYLEIEKRLQNKTISLELEHYKEEFIKIFKKMLDYKNKSYENDISFNELVKKVDANYYLISEDIANIENAIDKGYIEYHNDDESVVVESDEDPVELIYFLENQYEYLKQEKNYDEIAYFYRDFEPEEGKTYEDLYDSERAKLIGIFKEMLDYRNVQYEANESYTSLKYKVQNEYPFFQNALSLMSPDAPYRGYIDMLDSMVNVEENLLSRYKNYDEEMKKYQASHQQDDVEMDDDLFEDE